MPQITRDQARVAQEFTLWFNNLDVARRTGALCITPREALAQWVDATGATVADFDTAADLLDSGAITIDDGPYLRTSAWS